MSSKMNRISDENLLELLAAMDNFKTTAKLLIEKVITETNQPQKAKIEAGEYCEIQNAAILNGEPILSDNWTFEVHGEHCRFENEITNQVLEVSLVWKDPIGDLDPHFFYNFLQTTETLKHLTMLFVNPFSDTLNFFEYLEKKNLMIRVSGIQFRKV